MSTLKINLNQMNLSNQNKFLPNTLFAGLKFLHGGKKFTNKKITPDLFVKDIRYMQIILLQAERAWAYAMDLKQFANTESRKQV